MADGKPGGSARKTAIGDQSAHLVEFHRLEVGGRVEHLLHTRPATGAFVADDHHVARLNGFTQDAVAGLLLRIKNPGTPPELQNRRIYARRLEDTAVAGHIPVEHRQSAILAVGMRQVTDASRAAVGIGLRIVIFLGAQNQVAPAARGREVFLQHLLPRVGLHDIVTGNGFGQGESVDSPHRGVEEATPVQFGEDPQNPPCTVDILDMVGRTGGHFAQIGGHTRKLVYVMHGKVDPRLVGDGQQVKHRIGGATHGNVEFHGIEK